MEKLIKQWIEIEENLKTELQRFLLVMMNSSNINFIRKKSEDYRHQILLEITELNLENMSDRKLRSSLSYLENKLNIYHFKDFVLSQDKDYDINPLLRLYSQLKNEMIKRTKETKLTNIFEIIEFYLNIYEQRLLASYESVFKKQIPRVDISYLPILYNTMYSFIGLEEISSYKIHLKDWVQDMETFKTIEMAQVSQLFYEYLRMINQKPITFLYDSFIMQICSIQFYTLLNLLLDYFTIDEIFDKIDETLKEEEKKEFIGYVFLNSKKNYIKVLERMRNQ